MSVAIKYGIGDYCTVVGHNKFAEQAPCDLTQAAREVIRRDPARTIELRQHVAGALDGSGNELRKERNVRKESNRIAFDLYLSAIDANCVGQGLKGIETQAHRQNDTQGRRLKINSEGGRGVN
jgi:hypothetical protein